MFFLERGDFDDGSLDSLVPLSSRPHLLANLNLNEKLLMPRVRVLVNVKVQKMSKEDLEGRTSGIFVFWLFVEFCVVHALGGCIRMITDDGPLSPNLAMTPPTRVTKGRTLPTVSSAALVDQLIRCCPRSHRSCTMYIFF